jgi:hypothetical protein
MSRPILLNTPKNINNNITKQVIPPPIPKNKNDINAIMKLIKVIKENLLNFNRPKNVVNMFTCMPFIVAAYKQQDIETKNKIIDTTKNVHHVEKKNIINIIHAIHIAKMILIGTNPIFNIMFNDFQIPLKSALLSNCSAFFSNSKNVTRLANQVKIK